MRGKPRPSGPFKEGRNKKPRKSLILRGFLECYGSSRKNRWCPGEDSKEASKRLIVKRFLFGVRVVVYSLAYSFADR